MSALRVTLRISSPLFRSQLSSQTQTVAHTFFTRTMSIDIGGMRKPYNTAEATFDLKDLAAREPFKQFTAWFDEAKGTQHSH